MESPDPLFNAKGHADSQAKEQVTPRPGGCVTGNPDRSQSRGRGASLGGARTRTVGVLLYNFKCFIVFSCSRASFFCTTPERESENRKKMQKKVLSSCSRPCVVHFLTSFLKIICRSPAWCNFYLKYSNSLDETLKNRIWAITGIFQFLLTP